ncbi:MAG: hypothetical protein K8S14_07475 [Actinomycetia bacterium]|nr:hypothetical protein [Actinomycetes bacterium]
MNLFSKDFIDKFDFYLDSFDEAINLQSKIGFTEKELTQFDSLQQNLIKSYLFFAESTNTTAIGALRLFNSNLHSDTYSLIRIIYEIACVMHYGNISNENKLEVYKVFFKSELTGEDQSKSEWKLIQKSQRQFELEKEGLIPVRKELNNYGSHLSSKKMFIGNLTVLESASASSLFIDNSGKDEFLKGLEFLHFMYNLVLEEYAEHLLSCNGATITDMKNIQTNTNGITNRIRPRLMNMRNKNI